MPSIKLIAGGESVILKNGNPSCTCCDGCSCDESLEDTYSVSYYDLLPPETVTRESPCVWSGEWNQTPFGMQPLELRCEDGNWILRFYFSGGGTSDVLKSDPTTASPVGDYDGGNPMSVS